MGSSTFDEGFERIFAELYVAKRPALRVLGNSAEAEDVAAETLARLYVHWTKLAGRPDVAGWVVRVATNLAIDEVRRRLRRRTLIPAPNVESDADRRIDLARAIATLRAGSEKLFHCVTTRLA